MNRKSLKFTIFSLVLLFFMTAGRAYPQSAPGVSPGDTFTYSFSVFWSSSDPNATVPAGLLKQNETELIHVVVTNVSGSVVFMNITWQLKNGTTTDSQVFVNLLNGGGDGYGLVISPGLSAKHYAYPQGWNFSHSFEINETLVRTYPFGERETLHATVKRTDSPSYVYVFYDMYFDKKTGMMLEWYVEQVPYATPSETISTLWKIQEFNVKSAPPNNQPLEPSSQGILSLIILSLIIIIPAAAFVAILFRKRKRGRPARARLMC